MSQMLKSSSAIAIATLVSRVLGLVREMAYAQFMGTGLVASAFTYAFTIPNLFRRLLGEGALTAAFIPHFKEKEKTAGEAQMWEAASAVISGLVLVTTGVVVLLMLGSSLLIASGLLKARTVLMLDLLRWMSPYLLMVCLASVFMGMLNAKGHFFVPAMGSTMLNIVMIASVYWLAPRMGHSLQQQVFGVAIGVVVAGVAQALYQMPLLRKEGYRYRWITPWKHESVRFVSRQMIPGIVGVAAFQLNVLISQGLGFWIADHVVSSFGYAVRLMELPQGLFGVSMATYLLPTLSGFAAERNFPQFRSTLREGLAYVLFTNTIAGVLLVVLAEPIVRLLFERGTFDSLATSRVTFALQFLAPSLVAYSTVNILARAFYALGDTGTPTRISIFCLVLNLALVGLLVSRFQQGGMGMANTISSAANALLLVYGLKKKMGHLDFRTLRSTMLRLAISGIVAGGLAWSMASFWRGWLGHERWGPRLGEVFVPALVAGLVYWTLTAWMGVAASAEIGRWIKKALRLSPRHS